jgi:hypothetical protein
VQVRAATVLCAEALRLLAGGGAGVISMVKQRLDDGVVAEGDLSPSVCVAGEVMPGIEAQGVVLAARCAVRMGECTIGTETKVQTSTNNIVRGRECVCAA